MNNTVETLSAELEEAQHDAALLQRLMNAEDRVKRLTEDVTKAKVAHDQSMAEHAKKELAAAKAAEDAKYADLSDLTITEKPGTLSSSVLSSQFIITYNRVIFDGHESLPRPEKKSSFNALEPRVLSWIVQRHADQIPLSIRSLGDTVDEALDRYFVGLRRGQLRS